MMDVDGHYAAGNMFGGGVNGCMRALSPVPAAPPNLQQVVLGACSSSSSVSRLHNRVGAVSPQPSPWEVGAFGLGMQPVAHQTFATPATTSPCTAWFHPATSAPCHSRVTSPSPVVCHTRSAGALSPQPIDWLAAKQFERPQQMPQSWPLMQVPSELHIRSCDPVSPVSSWLPPGSQPPREMSVSPGVFVATSAPRRCPSAPSAGLTPSPSIRSLHPGTTSHQPAPIGRVAAVGSRATIAGIPSRTTIGATPACRPLSSSGALTARGASRGRRASPGSPTRSCTPPMLSSTSYLRGGSNGLTSCGSGFLTSRPAPRPAATTSQGAPEPVVPILAAAPLGQPVSRLQSAPARSGLTRFSDGLDQKEGHSSYCLSNTVGLSASSTQLQASARDQLTRMPASARVIHRQASSATSRQGVGGGGVSQDNARVCRDIGCQVVVEQRDCVAASHMSSEGAAPKCDPSAVPVTHSAKGQLPAAPFSAVGAACAHDDTGQLALQAATSVAAAVAAAVAVAQDMAKGRSISPFPELPVAPPNVSSSPSRRRSSPLASSRSCTACVAASATGLGSTQLHQSPWSTGSSSDCGYGDSSSYYEEGNTSIVLVPRRSRGGRLSITLDTPDCTRGPSTSPSPLKLSAVGASGAAAAASSRCGDMPPAGGGSVRVAPGSAKQALQSSHGASTGEPNNAFGGNLIDNIAASFIKQRLEQPEGADTPAQPPHQLRPQQQVSHRDGSKVAGDSNGDRASPSPNSQTDALAEAAGVVDEADGTRLETRQRRQSLGQGNSLRRSLRAHTEATELIAVLDSAFEASSPPCVATSASRASGSDAKAHAPTSRAQLCDRGSGGSSSSTAMVDAASRALRVPFPFDAGVRSLPPPPQPPMLAGVPSVSGRLPAMISSLAVREAHATSSNVGLRCAANADCDLHGGSQVQADAPSAAVRGCDDEKSPCCFRAAAPSPRDGACDDTGAALRRGLHRLELRVAPSWRDFTDRVAGTACSGQHVPLGSGGPVPNCDAASTADVGGVVHGGANARCTDVESGFLGTYGGSAGESTNVGGTGATSPTVPTTFITPTGTPAARTNGGGSCGNNSLQVSPLTPTSSPTSSPSYIRIGARSASSARCASEAGWQPPTNSAWHGESSLRRSPGACCSLPPPPFWLPQTASPPNAEITLASTPSPCARGSAGFGKVSRPPVSSGDFRSPAGSGGAAFGEDSLDLSSLPSPLRPQADDGDVAAIRDRAGVGVCRSSRGDASPPQPLLDTLRQRALILRERLLQRERQCNALREALDSCTSSASGVGSTVHVASAQTSVSGLATSAGAMHSAAPASCKCSSVPAAAKQTGSWKVGAPSSDSGESSRPWPRVPLASCENTEGRG